MMDFDYLEAQKAVSGVLADSDGGELFAESFQQEIFSYSDGVLSNTDYSQRMGFGLRAFVGDKVALVHSNGFDQNAIKKAVQRIKMLGQMHSNRVILKLDQNSKAAKHYDATNTLEQEGFKKKTEFLKKVDSYIRDQSTLVKQVSINLIGSTQDVSIVTKDRVRNDYRPMVKLTVMVIVEKDKRYESGFASLGGRYGYDELFLHWQMVADKALRQALTNLNAIPVQAGEMIVVLGNGFPGVLLHEAVGHGLEGDANRKQSSAFSDLMGKKIAAPGVTVVDNGTLWGRSGSLNMDDEGNNTQCNVLIDNGVLVSYMNDGVNGNLLGTGSTGNGRRSSYSDLVIPRMTNTYMLEGNSSPEEIIKSVQRGVYAVDFSGGQVDTTSGKFVFSASEAYMIENGKVTSPLKKITLIGSGPSVLKKISMIGNDLSLDAGTGLCVKAGQALPVCVGQPTLRLDGITVGGSK